MNVIVLTQRRSRKALAAFTSLMLFILLLNGCPSMAGQESGFTYGGAVDDFFDGKHDLSATFAVSTFESNALIDMTFETGFRQVVGTDGRDNYTFIPFIAKDQQSASGNGQAVISNGRFPADGHEFQQFLWLMSVGDTQLVQNLHSRRFPFYNQYGTNDITIKVVANSFYPNLMTSVKWFAPKYMVSGTNHYDYALYPNGYLLAELTTAKTKSIDGSVIPTEVEFRQYNQAPINPNDLQPIANRHYSLPPIRNQTNVVPVEVTRMIITNVQESQPLSSYVPTILDKTARINDQRIPEMGVAQVISSGKWWNARELYKGRKQSIVLHRKVVQVILSVSVLLPALWLIRRRLMRKSTS